jgi:hypothetical protein
MGLSIPDWVRAGQPSAGQVLVARSGAMAQTAVMPCWLAALTPEGVLRFRDVAEIVSEGREQLLAALRRQVGGHVDRVRVHHRAGTFEVYAHEYGPRMRRLPRNAHATRVLLELGMDLGYCVGSVLFLGLRHDEPVGLSQRQMQLLRELAGPSPSSLPVT